MAIARHLGDQPIPGSVVPMGNWHLTFRFVGAADQVTFDRLLAGLDETPLPGPFDVRLGGLGAFPGPRKASVLWIDLVAGTETLTEIHAAVADACESAGLDPEERPFRPHVTVSRIRPPTDVRSLMEATPSLDVRARIDEIVVFGSHPGVGAPRYEALERFPL